MRYLDFHEAVSGSRIREAAWRRKSRVPLERICAAANIVGGVLSGEFGELEISVHEPTATDPALIAALLAEAELFRLNSESIRAWIFLDSITARRLVAAAFGETASDACRPWTALEREALCRIVHDIATGFAPLIGKVAGVEAAGDPREALGAASLVAVRINRPVNCEIDLLLASFAEEQSSEVLAAEILSDVALRLRAIAGTIKLRISDLRALQIGAVLPMSKEERAYLAVDRTVLAHGTCGISGDRLAFQIAVCDESQGA